MPWFLVVLGILGGFLARRVSPSGKMGLALGLVPALGLYLAIEFC